MPSGGKRQGAGREFGSLNKRHQVTVKDIGHDGYLPIEYMLALMRDERTEATRRDAMAVQAAPYVHARFNAVGFRRPMATAGGDVNIVQIIAVPRGGRLDPKSGTITIDGELVTEPPNVEPYQPTPPLELTDQTEQPAPIAEALLSSSLNRRTFHSIGSVQGQARRRAGLTPALRRGLPRCTVDIAV